MSGPSLPISHFLDSSRPPSQSGLLAAHTYSRSPLPPIQDTIPDTVQEGCTDTGALGAPHQALQAHAHATAPISHPSVEHSPLAPASTRSPATPASKGHTGASLYACGDCGRRYSRPEHLQRHVQTHTLGRRFACSVCGKTFARADLKQRHESNHDNDSAKKRRRTDTSPAASRVTHACKACATARVKCQEIKPCQRCVKRGLTCVSSEAGSTAAKHLMNLSANAHTTSKSSPEDTETPSPSVSYNRQALPNTASLTGHQGADLGLPFPRSPPIKPEEGQLPTPDTVVEQGHFVTQPLGVGPEPNAVDMNRPMFSDFLRDVLYDQPFHPARMADNQGLAVLDFCDDSNLDLTDMDFGILDHWIGDGIMTTPLPKSPNTPQPDSSVDISQMRRNLVKVWTDSPWRWHPTANDNGYREQGNLPVPTKDVTSAQFQERRKKLEKLVKEKLEPSSRDRMLAIVLSTCRQISTANRVASSFPAVDVMDTLVQIFLNSHACQVSGWIHFPTLRINQQWPEWIAVAAASGAMLTPILTLRKFGMALQEAVRVTVPSRFEDNNTSIQNLGLVQSLILGQDIGLWSGNRRKMEIAECNLAIPITIMRYRGKFQRASYPIISLSVSDEGAVLDDKWKSWVETEQWKRLVFHCFIREAQSSMTTLTNMAMSYSELTLPLPESRELWFAKSAKEWKELYLQKTSGQAKRGPSVGDLIHDINLLTANRHRLDVQLSISVLLHASWALILEYRQLGAVHRSRSYTANSGGTHQALLSSRHQELVKDLQTLQVVTADWLDISTQERLLLNLLMMNLHVSLDDLQLFAGKEGEDQARRIYPVLQNWVESTDARLAIWCAGQVLRYAKLFPPGHLKDFYAVAVHHAALALWTYGVVARANRQQTVVAHHEMILLDDADSMILQQFISFGQGRPVVRGPLTRDGVSQASVEDPRACVEIAQDVLKDNFTGGQEGAPPIVENLCGLIRQLGNAAWAVGLG